MKEVFNLNRLYQVTDGSVETLPFRPLRLGTERANTIRFEYVISLYFGALQEDVHEHPQ